MRREFCRDGDVLAVWEIRPSKEASITLIFSQWAENQSSENPEQLGSFRTSFDEEIFLFHFWEGLSEY